MIIVINLDLSRMITEPVNMEPRLVKRWCWDNIGRQHIPESYQAIK